jgi:hypothetical protein
VTLKGGIGVVQGILDSAITINSTPQSIIVKVNGVDTVYNNVIITGDQNHDSLGPGNSIFIVLQGSTPLIATFTGSTITVDELESNFTTASQRTIPISSSGQLQASFAIPILDNRDGVQWTWPAFSLNGLTFPNGATGAWSAFPSSYNLTLPTPGVNTQQTVTFPGTAPKPLFFQFHATAAAGDLLMQGIGATNPLTVSGVVTGNPTVMTAANLDIRSGKL